MGTAIMKGIAGSSVAEKTALYAYDPDKTKVEMLSESGVAFCESESDLVKKCKYVFLAVKPQIIETFLNAAPAASRSECFYIDRCRDNRRVYC